MKNEVLFFDTSVCVCTVHFFHTYTQSTLVHVQVKRKTFFFLFYIYWSKNILRF